jgi:two-component system, LytTR family, response regulator
MRNNKICFRSKKGISFINEKEIVFCEASGRYTFLKTRRKMTIISENLKSVEEKLNKRIFVRIHHSTIVNLDFIKEYQSKSNELILNNGKKLFISVRKKKLFLKRVNSYYK